MMNVITLCSGYDSQLLALQEASLNFELVAWSEIDKYAIQLHDALWPEYSNINVGDITLPPPAHLRCDLLTYSTPCQDVSIAGKRRGIEKGSNTRSSIVWSVLDWIDSTQPDVAVMENVRGLLSTNFPRTWTDELKRHGYTSVMCCTDAAGWWPQHRERVFIISFKDAAAANVWSPPIPPGTTLTLKDLLDAEVSNRYVLKKGRGERIRVSVCPTLRTKHRLAVLNQTSQARRVYDGTGVSPAIQASKPPSCDDGSVWRHLTPTEAYRFMGVPEWAIERLLGAAVSETQHYKAAGNSICVPQLAAVLLSIYCPYNLFS